MDSKETINFLEKNFQAKVKCSCPEDDFHLAENLVSCEREKPNRGFIAYRVIKPPIDLEFKLCCCIELMSMKIWPQIDSLKSTGFEIHANGDDHQTEYRKIANHFNLKENGIQLINDLTSECNKDCDSHFAVIPFFPSVKNLLRKVKNIKVIIKQTTRCVPVIRKIEVWGRVSKFASNEQKQFVRQAITNSIELQKTIDSSQNNEVNSRTPQTNLDPSESSLIIPEDFLDAITYEIMSLPMVLPSGKTIDNSTLLKHSEHEEKWGRAASDPFTGQYYTDARKPVLNVHLKSQIDAFLLKNSNATEISMLPRTVGSIPKRRVQSTNNFDLRHHKIAKIETPSVNGMAQISSSSTFRNIPSSSTTSFSPSSLIAAATTTTTPNQSLDDAVRSVLKIGKYTTSTVTNHTLNPNKCFQSCESINGTVLYTIASCSHLICRNCLVDKNLKFCKCGKEFSNIDIKKYHCKTFL